MPGVTGSVLATAVHGRSLTTCIVCIICRIDVRCDTSCRRSLTRTRRSAERHHTARICASRSFVARRHPVSRPRRLATACIRRDAAQGQAKRFSDVIAVLAKTSCVVAATAGCVSGGIHRGSRLGFLSRAGWQSGRHCRFSRHPAPQCHSFSNLFPPSVPNQQARVCHEVQPRSQAS